ncbi:MAG: hypothetical protein HKP61_21280, partial [Dactylosporangium sp.]|nr:hypothetical protein [Dactylosporangium sp.]NNJ63415.1 hypothetical protein [Dactylosporangium sp.]
MASGTRLLLWKVALALALAVAAGLMVERGAARPARAEDPPAQATSAATAYQVTFAARVCQDYSKIMIGRVRDDRIE